MDAQAISVVIGVVGAAIAALGLLLTWYRSDRSATSVEAPALPGRWFQRIRSRRGVALSVIVTIGVLTLVGVVSALLISPTPPPGQAAPLTEAQYRSELTRACLDADDEAQRIVDSEPEKTVFGVNVYVERHLVDRLRRLVPPKSAHAAHDELVGTWDRRVTVIEAIYRKSGNPGSDVQDDLAAASALATRITELTTSLGVPECGFG